MRALSLTQPWAWLVVHGGKNIENRRWNTKLRGAFLIHAAKGMTLDQYDDAVLFAMDVDPSVQVPAPEALQRGGIIGVAELVDVISPTPVPHVQWSFRWHMREQHGFVLQNVRPLPFLPCKGALGFWGNFELVDGAAIAL
jgi:hypothetical protein